RPVTAGIRGISMQEITSGVEVGDLVVTEGVNRLVDGTPVEVINYSKGNSGSGNSGSGIRE
ncbi:MAG: hypothetical protein F6K26_28770, partial [Moorea sp. SIO2I5]|nr:hypothetical protein [Moorena sp. SIO2I5]